MGRALNPGRVTLLPDPRARPALCVSATKGWRLPEFNKTTPWLGPSRTRGQADALSGRRLSAQPTERLCSSMARLGPFRQLPRPIIERSSQSTLPIRCRVLGPPLLARQNPFSAPASDPVACRELEFHSVVQRPVKRPKATEGKNKRVKKKSASS